MRRYVWTLAVALVLTTGLRADEAAVAEAINKLRGSVERDEKLPGKPVVAVRFNGTKVTDEGLKDLQEIKQLQSLDLSFTQVTGAGLKNLKGLKQLQSLTLGGTKITDADLRELQQLPQLQYLNLGDTATTDAALKEL